MKEFKEILIEASDKGSPINKKFKTIKEIHGFLKTMGKYFKNPIVKTTLYFPDVQDDMDVNISLFNDKLKLTGPQLDTTVIDPSKDKIDQVQSYVVL